MNSEKANVAITVTKDLCISCGICASVCPVHAISFRLCKGQLLPQIDGNCIDCGNCKDVCPGLDIRATDYKIKANDEVQSFVGYSLDSSIRNRSASGGVLTSIILELLSAGEYDCAFVMPSNEPNIYRAKVESQNEINGIIGASKSKYVPVSMVDVISEIKKGGNRKIIVIGTGCNILGIKKFIKKFGYSEKNILFCGLFCSHCLNFNFYKWFEKKYFKRFGRIKNFYFKSKKDCGWPGNMEIVFEDGRELFLDKSERMYLKPYFVLPRCLYCKDLFNKNSDVAFGDCYIKHEANKMGVSSIVAWSLKGKFVLEKFSTSCFLKPTTFENIFISQRINKFKEFGLLGVLKKRLNTMLGQHSLFAFISTLIKIQKFSHFLMKTVMKASSAVMFLKEYCLFIYFTYTCNDSVKNLANNKNILITGGDLFNKGAQAMTFTVVDEIKKLFPDKKVFLLSQYDSLRSYEEKKQYNFEILPWDEDLRKSLLKIHSASKTSSVLLGIIRESSFCIDISGFALSSVRGWRRSFNYLMNIAIARKYRIPFYIFPQSIGPFNYRFPFNFLLYPLLKAYLKYPRVIFQREEDPCIFRFTKDNVKFSNDIVLRSKTKIELTRIFKSSYEKQSVMIKNNSVAIIPNKRVFERCGKTSFLTLNIGAIKTILGRKYNVYLIPHAEEDLELCELIKNHFEGDAAVQVVRNNLNVMELDEIFANFNFVIASRYHSIIHAYKNDIPAIVIGWSQKYEKLLQDFRQSEYYMSWEEAGLTRLNQMIIDMFEKVDIEKKKIAETLAKINEFATEFQILKG